MELKLITENLQRQDVDLLIVPYGIETNCCFRQFQFLKHF